jgi:hypothetical protein
MAESLAMHSIKNVFVKDHIEKIKLRGVKIKGEWANSCLCEEFQVEQVFYQK